MYPRLAEDCPECNGYLLHEDGQTWLKHRKTSGMICMMCGTNYGPPITEEESDDPDLRRALD